MTNFAVKEVSNHNSRESLWLIIHGSVYDVTKFLHEHPGGEEVFLDAAGNDATECFDAIGHTTEAKSLMKKFKIGEISKHPGGEEVLLEQAGKDATEQFEDVGHSSDAREMMTKYKIGELAESDRKKEAPKEKPKWEVTDNDTSSSWTAWVIPAALAIAATVIYRFFFAK
ncbi:cytochrome b5 isoform X1 [Planococcus citri]|uniref:cytochrome b5 isoform X1 n=1 Tax=Planococcus citri TaxID=170843 RepID=UPI0031F98228